MILNDGQQAALGEILASLEDGKQRHLLTGFAGTGKTTLVLAFQEFLLLRGFTDVSVLDPDLTPNGGRPRGHNGVRLAALAARDPSVCIAAVMAPKGRPSPQPAPCHEELF